MQVLIYKKTISDEYISKVTEWENENIDKLFGDNFINGSILLLKKSDFDLISSNIKKRDILNCFTKKEKIELFRAFQFDIQKYREQSRRLIADFATLSAFKRSFYPFLNKRYNYNHPPCLMFIPDEILDEVINMINKEIKKSFSKDPISLLMSEALHQDMLEKISKVYIGNSVDIKFTRLMICKAAHTVLPVLILGESGTGKELIARQIYEQSLIYKAGLFTVNCSSLPETLLESELFGHIKGSFTDASQDKTGILEAANGGTVFLDEIGDLSLPNQAKLLRALEEKEIRPLGSNKSKKIDIRILAATNRNLSSMMKQKSFREDLYYRLNSMIVPAFPLREHPDDIPGIASKIWHNLGKTAILTPEFTNALKNYSWPGNVRELKTLLTTISELFDVDSPQSQHIDAIRDFHKRILTASQRDESNDFDKMLKAESRNRIIEVQNIIRGIKVKFRPIINKQFAQFNEEKFLQLKSYIELEANKLDNICREPIYFKNQMLFDRITRFRYILEKTINNWNNSTEELYKRWHSELSPLYEHINTEVFDMIWGKVDL